MAPSPAHLSQQPVPRRAAGRAAVREAPCGLSALVPPVASVARAPADAPGGGRGREQPPLLLRPDAGAGSQYSEPGSAGSSPRRWRRERARPSRGWGGDAGALPSAAPTCRPGPAGRSELPARLPAAGGLRGRGRARPQPLPEEVRAAARPARTPPPAAPARRVRTPPPAPHPHLPFRLSPPQTPDSGPAQPGSPNLSGRPRPRPCPLPKGFAVLFLCPPPCLPPAASGRSLYLT